MTGNSARASGSLPEGHPLYAPGLSRRPRLNSEACYWIPPPKDIERGYRPKCITLPSGLSEQDLAAQCRRLWQGLLEWRVGRQGPTNYSIAWLIDRYLSDKESPFNVHLGHRAQRSYAQFCKIIRGDVGERRIDPDGARPRILGEHVRTWHRKWGEPAEGKTVARPARARHLIVQLRLLVSYAIELGVPGATDLRLMLKVMRFPQPEARAVAPNREQVIALVDKAIELGRPSIAGVSLAQFWFMERRCSIIGSYVNKEWCNGWVWSDISEDWTVTYYQTKTGKVLRVFDIKTVQPLLALLQAIPKERRFGAVFKDEKTGRPWRERHFAEVFAEIKTAAGWPEELKSMDLRAGGATDADAAGVSDRELQDAGGWRDPKTKDRYRRNKQRNAQNVVDIRQGVKR